MISLPRRRRAKSQDAGNENSNSLFLTIGPEDFLVQHAIALGHWKRIALWQGNVGISSIPQILCVVLLSRFLTCKDILPRSPWLGKAKIVWLDFQYVSSHTLSQFSDLSTLIFLHQIDENWFGNVSADGKALNWKCWTIAAFTICCLGGTNFKLLRLNIFDLSRRGRGTLRYYFSTCREIGCNH